MVPSKDNETKKVILQQLIQKDGVYYERNENKPFTGIAFQPRLQDNPFDLSEKIAEKAFLDGKLHGLSTWFSRNGEKKLQMQFKKGKLHGQCEQLIQDGNQKIFKKQQFKNGALNGVCEWHKPDDGCLIKRETYANGLRHGPRIDYYNRRVNSKKRKWIKKQGNYSCGVPDGKWQSYYPGNILKRTGLYKMGKRHGLWEWFYENRWRMNSISYNYGKLNGLILSFHKEKKSMPNIYLRMPGINSASIETKGMFINSKREGIWQRFYPDGKLLCKVTYKEGAIIEWECFDQLGQPQPFGIAVSNKRKPYIDVVVFDYWELDDNAPF